MDVLKNLKVLYVEDDDNTRAGLERFLKRRFGKVYTAENGEKGIESFNEHHPDIAIIDILLPGISGLEMIKKIREIDSKCRFFITSTVSDVSTILKAVDLDISNYIIKPINTDELEDKLKRTGSSIMKAHSTTSPPHRRISLTAASADPPVAIRSSTSRTWSPGRMSSVWISNVLLPYSRS